MLNPTQLDLTSPYHPDLIPSMSGVQETNLRLECGIACMPQPWTMFPTQTANTPLKTGHSLTDISASRQQGTKSINILSPWSGPLFLLIFCQDSSMSMKKSLSWEPVQFVIIWAWGGNWLLLYQAASCTSSSMGKSLSVWSNLKLMQSAARFAPTVTESDLLRSYPVS